MNIWFARMEETPQGLIPDQWKKMIPTAVNEDIGFRIFEALLNRANAEPLYNEREMPEPVGRIYITPDQEKYWVRVEYLEWHPYRQVTS